MKIENLFPTPIGVFSYDSEITTEQRMFLLDQEQRPNEGNTTSKDSYILKNKVFDDLTTYIENCLHKYLTATLCPKNDVRLKITQSWLNWTKPNQYHHLHRHSNSLISGCFYFSADKQTDRIYFHNDVHQHIKMTPMEWNLYNSESWWLPVGTNDLILFPSSLIHRVAPVQGDMTRISLAFNTFPVGNLGEESELTALTSRC